MSDLIVVTGATGNVGAPLVEDLLARGAHVRVVSTNPDSARQRFGERPEYARLVFGDASTYSEAFSGADKVFVVRPPEISNVGRDMLPALNAAAWAGARHFVLLSLQGAERNPVVPHRKLELHLERSGLAYTFLRPSFFMQNLTTTHLQDLRERAEVYVPAGQGRTSFIDARDIAAVAARVLTEPGWAGKALELTGTEALTYSEVARLLSQASGRAITYPDPSPIAFYQRWRARGKPAAFILVMEALYAVSRFGLAGRVTPETGRVLGRPPISFAQFARDYAGVYAGAGQGSST